MIHPLVFRGAALEARTEIFWSARRKARGGLRLLPRSASSGVGPNGRRRSAQVMRRPE